MLALTVIIWLVGWAKDSASWGATDPNIFASPHRQINFHSSSALHKIRDLVFYFFRRQYDRHCLQRFLDTAHCRHFDGSSPQAIFFWHHHWVGLSNFGTYGNTCNCRLCKTFIQVVLIFSTICSCKSLYPFQMHMLLGLER